MLDIERFELKAEDVRAVCNPESLGDWATTAELPPLTGFFAQPRVIEGLAMGLDTKDKGYNILLIVPNQVGSVRAVTKAEIQNYVNAHWADFALTDKCYVTDFNDLHSPYAILMPRGEGRHFKEAMEEVRERLKATMRETFSSRWYTMKYEALRAPLNELLWEKKKALEEEFGKAGVEADFSHEEANWEGKYYIIPKLDIKDRSLFAGEFRQYMVMTVQHADDPENRRTYTGVHPNYIEIWLEHFGIETAERTRLADLVLVAAEEITTRRKDMGQQQISLAEEQTLDVFDRIIKESKMLELHPAAEGFISGLRQFVLKNRVMFTYDGSWVFQETKNDMFSVFAINVLGGNGVEAKDAVPVIWEDDPTFSRIVGSVIRPESSVPNVSMLGSFDHLSLVSGSIIDADGGVLVVPFKYLTSPAWEVLTNTLEKGEITIEDIGDRLLLTNRSGIGKFKPKPIPLNVRVVLVIEQEVAYKIFQLNPTFFRLFKARAEFVTDTGRTLSNEQKIATFLSLNSHRAGLLPCTKEATALFIEHASRLSTDKTKLSLNMGTLKDLHIQADRWARQQKGAMIITPEHVSEALQHQEYRSNVICERMRELIAGGTLLLSLDGSKVGQINGLVVLDLKDIDFGTPLRITATIQAGEKGVISIEREIKLSGRIHSKGVLILSGYLGEKFGQERPPAFTARLTLEQSYQGVEGDSASVAELCVLLSSLSGVSLRQDIAVTGSLNQKGEIQPIGGVNQKIEGMFDACMTHGLTGKQGVIIPSLNVKNLMLRPDVVEAVGKGQFHIWAITHVKEGIALLTGMEADELYSLVDKRLTKFATDALKWSRLPQQKQAFLRRVSVVDAWGSPAV